MAFTKLTATLKHNSDMSKADIEQGFERLEATDTAVFAYAARGPVQQGWRDKRETIHDGNDVYQMTDLGTGFAPTPVPLMGPASKNGAWDD